MFKHLEEANETYLEHFQVAARIAAYTAIGSFCCAVHAVVPCLFTQTGSMLLKQALEIAETRK